MIRSFEEKDAKVVSDLIARTLRETNIKDYSEQFIENYVRMLTPGYLIKQSKYTNFYVKIRENKIVGCGAVGPYGGSKTENSLFTVFVLLEYHGRGIVKEIIKESEKDEYFLRAKRVEIPTSITACQFYRKFGCDCKNGADKIDDEGFYRLEKFR